MFWSKANESLGIGVANLSNQVPLTPIPADAVVRKFDNLSTEQIKKIHICIKIMRDGPLCSLSSIGRSVSVFLVVPLEFPSSPAWPSAASAVCLLRSASDIKVKGQ